MRAIAYDGRGNTASETRPASATVTTGYDGHGRLISYVRTGDASQTNVYNGLDDRVTVTSGSTTRRYLYDADGRLLGEYGASASAANVVAETIWFSPEVAGASQPFGGDDGVMGYAPLAVSVGSTGTLNYVHGSHLGVPLVTTNTSGTVIAPGTQMQPGFPGQLRTFADLYYNRYRDYDTSIGRYIQADPIGLSGDPNPYLYALGNPVTGSDPMGLNAVWAIRLGVIGGEIAGEGLFWWCRSNIALCMRTIGPPAINIAKACNALSDAIFDNDNEDDPCSIRARQLRSVKENILNIYKRSGFSWLSQYRKAAKGINEQIEEHNWMCPRNRVAPLPNTPPGVVM